MICAPSFADGMARRCSRQDAWQAVDRPKFRRFVKALQSLVQVLLPHELDGSRKRLKTLTFISL